MRGFRLAVFFYVVVTPIGLAARCFGKDVLGLKLDTKASGYWLALDRSKPRQAADYEQQEQQF